MRFFIVLLLLALPVSAAIPHIVAYSTLPNFLCNSQRNPLCDTLHANPIPQSNLPDLISHLSTQTTRKDLPLATTASPPELILLVSSRVVDPEALLRRIAVAVTPATGSAVIASSFHATSDRHAIPSHLHDLAKHRLLSVPALTRLATDRSLPIFDDGFPDVVSLAIEDEHQPGLLAALHVLASRTKDKLAVIWASRDDIEPPADAKSQNTEDKTAEEKSAENKSADDKSEEEKPKEDKSAEDKPTEDKSAEDKPTEDKPADGNPAPPAQNSVSKNDNEMTAPEITSLQVTGLIVGFVFLLIFLSGFMCLWKIQPPQSFAIFDSNDLKKKMQ